MSWSRLRIILHHLENALLVVLFIVVIGAANTQIVLRNLFESSISWIDPFLRITILWLALMGAMVATRKRVHIAIDLFLRYLPDRWRLWMERLIWYGWSSAMELWHSPLYPCGCAKAFYRSPFQ
jgi:TRAP-type C4-dicarboxylate transport system permease small subunit